MISEQVVLSEQLVKDTQKTITELLKIHQFDSVDSVQAILSNMGCRIGKGKTSSLPLI
jgi:exonuclease SbcC